MPRQPNIADARRGFDYAASDAAAIPAHCTRASAREGGAQRAVHRTWQLLRAERLRLLVSE
jgi:hypothetical protein